MKTSLSHKTKRKNPVTDLSTPPQSWEEFRRSFDKLLSKNTSFLHSYLRSEWTSKLRDPAVCTQEARSTAAIMKWLSVEARNANTNRRLYALPCDFTWGSSDLLFDLASRFIRETIGANPPDDLISNGMFSSGASTSVRRCAGNVGQKFLGGTHVTERAWPHVIPVIVGSHLWATVWSKGGLTPNFQAGNVLFTVPKSTDIDRCAAKEPELNMFAQKAVGDYFRLKLKRRNIDLDDQTINQRLALIGSSDGSLATIDLSSASDSVTVQLVCRLLPVGWFTLLSDLRSPTTFISKQYGLGNDLYHENEMFSSMGNAFTFELQSLIFWALARATASLTKSFGRISVYGDDIIVPTKLAKPLITVLNYAGFKINLDKSHISGLFRESCGKHYFQGDDVTPFYVKEIPLSVDRWIHLANRLRGWLERTSIGGMLDPLFFDVWSKAASNVPLPLWGGLDTDRVDQLVASGIRPLAVLRRKNIVDWHFVSHDDPLYPPFLWRKYRGGKRAQEVSEGLYLQWLKESELSKNSEDNWLHGGRMVLKNGRFDPCNTSEVSNLSDAGPFRLMRYPRSAFDSFWSDVMQFPQERVLRQS